jgi:hypothetical protein
MGEEKNILGIVNMDYRYDDLTRRYEINHTSNEHIANVNDELVVPESFVKLLKKTIEGLENIKISSCNKMCVHNSTTFAPEYRYMVNLVLEYGYDCKNVGSSSTLIDIINTTFRFRYPEINNIKFSVIRVSILKRDWDKEFFDFFSKG